jgi:hypothetical protein
MANPNAPFGYRPFSHVAGGTPGRITKYTLGSAYNAALGEGDLVKANGTGTYGRANVVVAAATTDKVIGVFTGVEYTAPDGSVVRKNNWVASTATKANTPIWAYVLDDPDQMFLVQSSGTTAANDVGQFGGWVTGTVDAATGRSRQAGTIAGGSETTFKVVRAISAEDMMPCRNAAGNQDFYAEGAQGLWVVRLVLHELSSVATTEV